MTKDHIPDFIKIETGKWKSICGLFVISDCWINSKRKWNLYHKGKHKGILDSLKNAKTKILYLKNKNKKPDSKITKVI